jgi:ribonuclease P protein component
VKRRFRLKKTADFERVRRSGKSFAHPLIVLIVRENEGEGLRVGVAAGRSLGNAVTRNRAKRLLRSVTQAQLGSIKRDHDLLLIARKPMVDASFMEVQSAIQNLLQRANLICPYDD